MSDLTGVSSGKILCIILRTLRLKEDTRSPWTSGGFCDAHMASLMVGSGDAWERRRSLAGVPSKLAPSLDSCHGLQDSSCLPSVAASPGVWGKTDCGPQHCGSPELPRLMGHQESCARTDLPEPVVKAGAAQGLGRLPLCVQVRV